jgi:hypothetical protein
MSIYELIIVDGPSKPALDAGGSRSVSFVTDQEPVQIRIDACQDLGGKASGVVFQGKVESGAHAGRSVVGTYDPDTRHGSINLAAAP